MQLSEMSAKIRLTAEIFMFIAAVLYILAALREARFLGLHMFIENLVRVIQNVIFNIQKVIRLVLIIFVLIILQFLNRLYHKSVLNVFHLVTNIILSFFQ